MNMEYTREQIKSFLTPYKTKPLYYIDKSGMKYDYRKYNTRGDGNEFDLPKKGYPYTLEFEEQNPPHWIL